MLERLGLIVIMVYVRLRVRRLPRYSARPPASCSPSAAPSSSPRRANLGSLAIPAEGLFWGIISAFALAFYTLLPGKVLEKRGSFIVTGLAMLIGGAVATVAVQPWDHPRRGFAGACRGHVRHDHRGHVRRLPVHTSRASPIAGPVRAGLVGCVEPVSATVISAVWLGTPVGVVDVVGCAMIIGMVFLVTEREEGSGGAASYDGAAWTTFRRSKGAPPSWATTRRAVPRATASNARQALLEDGHRAMASLGIREGLKKYPSARRLMRSIDAGKTYVVVASSSDSRADGSSADEGRIIGMFALNPQGDPAYAHMTGAKWATEPSSPDNPAYSALHWVTVAADARRRGVGGYILGTAERIAKGDGKVSICCDIYEDNVPMRELLLSYGYQFCGNVEIRSRFGRVKHRAVFERVL